MTQPTLKKPATFGFITVVEIPSLGHCGGLLVVSQIGRPMEFHCTAPVRNNRAQEIMYGETYTGFLYADQIGMSLIDKASCQSTVFVTDCPDLLPICEQIDTPLVLAEKNSVSQPFDGQGLKSFSVDEKPVYCLNSDNAGIELVEKQILTFANSLPLEEPFERIRQAIGEAHTGLRAA